MRPEVEKEYDRIVDYYSESIGETMVDEPFLSLITENGRVFGRRFINFVGLDEDDPFEMILSRGINMTAFIETAIKGVIHRLEGDDNVPAGHRVSGVIIGVFAKKVKEEGDLFRIEAYDRDGNFWMTLCPVEGTGKDKEYIVRDVEPVVVGVSEEHGSVLNGGLWPWQ